jgi:hypothetical protein
VSLKKSVPPLHLNPGMSRHLALLLLLIHGAALVVVATLAAPVWVQIALISAVLVNFYSTFNTHVTGKSQLAVLSMVWDGEGEWTLLTNNGVSSKARLLPTSFVHPLLVVLNFSLVEKGRRSVILMQDSLDQKTFRNLLSRIRLEGNQDKSVDQ